MAVAQMKEGKKVKRENWDESQSSICIKNDVLWWFENDREIPRNVVLMQIDGAKDWEIVEEKGFIDELREADDNRCFGDICDVIRKRNKEFLDWLHKHGDVCPKIVQAKQKAKEIFGEDLIK